jgi:hypothetical protein
LQVTTSTEISDANKHTRQYNHNSAPNESYSTKELPIAAVDRTIANSPQIENKNVTTTTNEDTKKESEDVLISSKPEKCDQIDTKTKLYTKDKFSDQNRPEAHDDISEQIDTNTNKLNLDPNKDQCQVQESSKEDDGETRQEHDVIREISFDIYGSVNDDDDDNTTITNPAEIVDKRSSKASTRGDKPPRRPKTTLLNNEVDIGDSASIDSDITPEIFDRRSNQASTRKEKPPRLPKTKQIDIGDSASIDSDITLDRQMQQSDNLSQQEHASSIDDSNVEENPSDMDKPQQTASETKQEQIKQVFCAESSSSSSSSRTSSYESDDDWDSVDSSSGSEGDGLARGMKRKSAAKQRQQHHHKQPLSKKNLSFTTSSIPRPYLMSQQSASSFDSSSDHDIVRSKDTSCSSEDSLDHRDLFTKTPDEQIKVERKVERRVERIHKAAPLPLQLSPRRVAAADRDMIAEQTIFEHLVEQLDASMNSLNVMDDDENEGKEPEKPGPPKSPGNTTHERVYRQNFAGLTLSNDQIQNKVNNESDPDDDEPDFFDDDGDYLNTKPSLHIPRAFEQSTATFMSMDANEDTDTLLDDLQNVSNTTSSIVVTTNALHQPNDVEKSIDQFSTTANEEKKVESQINSQNTLNSSILANEKANDWSQKVLTKNDNKGMVSCRDIYDIDAVRSVEKSVNDANMKKTETATVDSTKSTSIKNPKDEHKVLGISEDLQVQMRELIDLDPWDDDAEFDEDQFADLVKSNPLVCKVKYSLHSFDAEVYPLSAICALDCSLETIKACYKAAPEVINDKHDSLGTPLHCACSFGAAYDVVKFLIKKNPSATTKTDEFNRIPLHA